MCNDLLTFEPIEAAITAHTQGASLNIMDYAKSKEKDPSPGAIAAEQRLLCRGAAIQSLVTLIERNSLATALKRSALTCLKGLLNSENGCTPCTDGPSSLRLSQSQLRLLRQEQLMLMAENERLVHELQELRLNRGSVSFSSTAPRSVPEFKESKLSRAIDLTLSGERDARYNTARLATLCGVISRLRMKVLGSAMRTLAKQPLMPLSHGGLRLPNSGNLNIRQITVACLIMETVVRSRVNRVKQSAVRLLKAAAEGQFVSFSPPNRTVIRSAVDARNLCLPGPHTSYHRQLPSVRRYMC